MSKVNEPTEKSSNDSLVHDLEADEAAWNGELLNLAMGASRKVFEYPDRPCHFCGKSALFEGAKQVQCVPYTGKAVCVECAKRLVDLR